MGRASCCSILDYVTQSLQSQLDSIVGLRTTLLSTFLNLWDFLSVIAVETL